MNGQCPFGDQCDFVHIDGLQRGVVGGGEWSPSSSMPYWEWPREGAESVRGHAPDTRAFPSLALKGSFVLLNSRIQVKICSDLLYHLHRRHPAL